ncbi:MAG: hypothetical protein DRP85_05345 [Candidatus Makaraimicrobium thalassicum]|nr:MAG: hypothetical protein DRP85_05345 [Candidatus Omnitrophota bacterium]
MKVRLLVCLVVIAVMVAVPLEQSFAGRKSSSDLLRTGLLGAGAGAVGGAASGAKGGDVWKGALAGAGVNIIGGALLDSISGEQVSEVERVDSVSPRTAYSDGYEAGYANGYKKGYTDGYKDGLKEAYKSE